MIPVDLAWEICEVEDVADADEAALVERLLVGTGGIGGWAEGEKFGRILVGDRDPVEEDRRRRCSFGYE